MRRLFLLTTAGLGSYYVISKSMDEAEKQLTAELNKSDYGSSEKRKIVKIKILGREIEKSDLTRNLDFNKESNLLILNGKVDVM